MRINCPVCGERDRREFYYVGNAVTLERPERNADLDVWDDYLHLRDNPAGLTRDLWHHEAGCGAWLVVNRNTVTHAVSDVVLAREVAR